MALVLATFVCGTSSFPTRSTAQTETPVARADASHLPDIGNSPGLRFAPPEPWVKKLPLDLDTAHPDAIDAGMYLRLRDQQVHLEKHARYSRFADEFVNIAGLHDQAEVLIEYDPAYQTLTLHEIVLHRYGRTIDVLAAAKEQGLLRLLTPEEDVNDKILSGHHQILLPVPGARVGDVLDYSYTVRGRSPFFGDEFTDQVFLQLAEPVQQLQYRLVKSPKRKLFWKGYPSDIQPRTDALKSGAGSDQDLEQHVWRQRDTVPVFEEPNTPEWYQPFAFIQISSFAIWNDVARHGHTFYDFAGEPLPSDLNKKIADIRLDHPTPEARALATVRMVQDDVRYLAITDGAAAYCPDSPATTWKRQFGDCKNKTTLLKRVLSELEIESTPVYVDLEASPRSFEWWPTPSALVFDHVILRIDFADGKTAWADGTVSHERGPLATTGPGDFILGLPLAEDTTGLEKFPTKVIHETPPHRHIVEKVQLGDIGEVSQLEVHATYRHHLASDKRHYFAANHPVLVQRSHARLYRQNFPGLEPPRELPRLTDTPETGELQFSQHYQLGELWQQDPADDGYYSVYVYFDSIRDSLKLPLNRHRSMPFSIGPPRHFQHTCIVSLPTDQHWEFEDEDHFLEEAGVRFERSVRQSGHELIIEVSLSNSEDHILPGKMQAYSDAVNDMIDLCRYSIWRLDDRGHAKTAKKQSSEPRPEDSAEVSKFPRSSPLIHLLELALIAVVVFLLVSFFRRR